jgi:hypothetical protein
VEDIIVVILPGILAGLAFSLYDETYDAFHKFVDFASSNTWQAVDGGAYLSDLLTPALNGPISTFISLLFGSLSSMTLSNLLNRQLSLSKLFSKLVEDIRLANIHFGYLPGDYEIEAKSILRNYAMELYKTFEKEYVIEKMNERRELRRHEIEKLMTLLHDISSDVDAEPNGRILDESYGTVKRIIDGRAEIAAVYDSQFPIWHYGNLILLASAICTIFFMLTDRPALVFLGAFQLRVAWSLLVCTISVMGCVIYDLNTPLDGVFQVVKESDRQFLKEFALESEKN